MAHYLTLDQEARGFVPDVRDQQSVVDGRDDPTVPPSPAVNLDRTSTNVKASKCFGMALGIHFVVGLYFIIRYSGKDLSSMQEECRNDLVASGRHLTEEPIPTPSVMSILEGHVGLVFSTILYTFIFGVLWIASLQRYAKQMMYILLSFNAALIFFLANGVDYSNPDTQSENNFSRVFLNILGVLCVVGIFRLKDRINRTGVMINQACKFTKANLTIFPISFAVILVNLVSILFFATSVYALEKGLGEFVITEAPDGEHDCTLEGPIFLPLVMMFITVWFYFFCNNIRSAMVASNCAMWYFGTHTNGENQSLLALSHALVHNIGSHVMGAMMVTVVEIIRTLAKSGSKRKNILSLLAQCIIGCLSEIIKMINKFTTIMIAITGDDFIMSAKRSFHLLKTRFVGGYITDRLGRMVLFASAFVFSVLVTALLAVSSSPFPLNSLFPSENHDGNGGKWFTIIFAMLLLVLPGAGMLVALFVPSLFTTACVAHGSVECVNASASMSTIIFVGCLTHIVLKSIAGILLDSVDTFFITFAIDAENGIVSGQRGELHEAINAYGDKMVIPTDMVLGMDKESGKASLLNEKELAAQ